MFNAQNHRSNYRNSQCQIQPRSAGVVISFEISVLSVKFWYQNQRYHISSHFSVVFLSDEPVSNTHVRVINGLHDGPIIICKKLNYAIKAALGLYETCSMLNLKDKNPNSSPYLWTRALGLVQINS